MSRLAELVGYIELPRMIEMRQSFPRPVIENPAAKIREELAASGMAARIRPGQMIALTGGSRGISNLPLIIRETAAFVKAQGAEPFIIPAMGSHGGATADGQREVMEARPSALPKKPAAAPSGPAWTPSCWGIPSGWAFPSMRIDTPMRRTA